MARRQQLLQALLWRLQEDRGCLLAALVHQQQHRCRSLLYLERQLRSHLRTLAEIHGLVTVFVSSHGVCTYGPYRQFCYDRNRSFLFPNHNVRRLASTRVLRVMRSCAGQPWGVTITRVRTPVSLCARRPRLLRPPPVLWGFSSLLDRPRQDLRHNLHAHRHLFDGHEQMWSAGVFSARWIDHAD